VKGFVSGGLALKVTIPGMKSCSDGNETQESFAWRAALVVE
jgi:hypothetical protein